MELTNETERRAEDFVKQIDSLMCDQQEDHDKLDNKNRCKQELEDKVEQIRRTKENLETRLKRLQDLRAESKATLMERTAKIQELNKQITETRDKSLNLENDITKITEQLSEADIDNNAVLRQIKKNETIKMLRQLYSGAVSFLLYLLELNNFNNKYILFLRVIFIFYSMVAYLICVSLFIHVIMLQ